MTTVATTTAILRRIRPEKRILIVSETNAAVGEDLARLIDKGWADVNTVRRVGEMKSRMMKYRDYYQSALAQDLRERLWHERIDEASIYRQVARFEQKDLSGAKVVFTILSHAGSPELLRAQFHIIINDEGDQTLEAALIQAIRASTESVIIIGDEFQLRGFSGLPQSVRDHFLSDDRRHKLNWSLMHAIAHKYAHRTRPSYPGITQKHENRSH